MSFDTQFTKEATGLLKNKHPLEVTFDGGNTWNRLEDADLAVQVYSNVAYAAALAQPYGVPLNQPNSSIRFAL